MLYITIHLEGGPSNVVALSLSLKTSCHTVHDIAILYFPKQYKVITRNGTSSNKIFVGIRDFHKNVSGGGEGWHGTIIGMDMSETVGFRPLTRKKFKRKYMGQLPEGGEKELIVAFF